jgi:hypothetical protein
MAANWTSFISNVKNYIVSQSAPNAKKFGEFVASEYISAVSSSTSIYGQKHQGSSFNLKNPYGTEFDRLQNENKVTGNIDGTGDLDPPVENLVDGDGKEIPFTGKASDPDSTNPAEPNPEYADPDMTEVSEPVIDPEEMRKFLDEHGSTYNLYKYRYFEFGLDGSETNSQLASIISNRILFSFLLETSGSKRKKMYNWIKSIGTLQLHATNITINNKRKAFESKLEDSLNDNGYDVDYIIDKVRWRTLNKLAISYDVSSFYAIYEAAGNGLPTEMKYNSGKKDFRIRVIQEPFDKDNESDDYKESPVITKEFIVYFTDRNNLEISSDWSESKAESKYSTSELKNKWCKIETVSTADDVVNKKNRAAPYMFTRQRTVDALAELEDDSGKDDPYMNLAVATIDYWKTTSVQPLASNPPALPCLSNLPLGGTYIPVYYGNKNKLAEDIRKALNSGKESNNKQEAALKTAKALSLAYARHLMSLKFIYQGGIPVPLVPYVPMLGFVPNVF